MIKIMIDVYCKIGIRTLKFNLFRPYFYLILSCGLIKALLKACIIIFRSFKIEGLFLMRFYFGVRFWFRFQFYGINDGIEKLYLIIQPLYCKNTIAIIVLNDLHFNQNQLLIFCLCKH